MELKPGYKQTDIGVIPEEWGVATFADLFRITAGGDVNPAKTTVHRDETHCYPLYSNALTNRGLYGYCSYSDHKAGSITITARGTLGSANFRDHAYTAIGRVLVLQPKSELSGRFFAEIINNRVRFAIESTGVPQLTAPQISTYRLPHPPLPEQRAIATALSAVDDLIATLDRLIAKKRDLKEAAMQQLLTGEQRLPGFGGEWEVKELGELGSTYGGLAGKTKADFSQGSAKYIPFLNVMNNVVIDLDHLESVSVGRNESQNPVAKGDLFFNGSSETPEEVGMCAVLLHEASDVYLNSFCFGFRLHCHESADGLYLAYFFRSCEGRKLLYALAQGATRHNLSKAALMALKFGLPALDEQCAIVSVLSDMDAEIAALEQRRDKTCDLKQGMMQELLTGTIRLI